MLDKPIRTAASADETQSSGRGLIIERQGRALPVASGGVAAYGLQNDSPPGKHVMSKRAALLVFGGLVAAAPVCADSNDILIGLDEKITFGPMGQVNSAPGSDAVLIMDISDPAKPGFGRPCR